MGFTAGTRHRTRKARPAALEILGRPCEESGAASGQIPEASEEQWQHRAEMRRKSVALVKSTCAYEWYSLAKPQRAMENCEPSTPDAMDRTISKRQWRCNVERWRTF